MDAEVLRRHRDVWTKKAVLRRLYATWYEEIASYVGPGLTVEIGGGSGNLKEHFPNVVSTDIVPVPWLDVVADCEHLPFKSSLIQSLVLFDVLHHICRLDRFWEEAQRVLALNGRVIIMDPYVSWLSWPVYRFLHPEPVDFGVDPLYAPLKINGHAAEANQAVATMLFEKPLMRFCQKYPSLRVRARRRLAFFAYPLSGGFDHASLIPPALVRPLVALERRFSFLSRLLAFRILVVLEKVA